MSRKILILLLPVLLFSLTLAQILPMPEPPVSILGCLQNSPLRFCILVIFLNVLRILLVVALVLAALFIVWGGIEYILAGGGDTKGAKAKIMNAVIGLVVAFLAWAMVLIISSFLQRQTF